MNATMPIGAELNFVQTLREDNRNRERQMQLTPVTAGFFGLDQQTDVLKTQDR